MKYKVADAFPYYAELTEGFDLKEIFARTDFFEIYNKISEEESKLQYAEGKWTLKQIMGHMTDHERIMLYRALRFSRNDDTLLSGYDQDQMVNNSRFNDLTWAHLVNELKCVRASSICFIEGLSANQLQLKGQAWKYSLTVEEFLRATIGHEMHHINIIKEKYLPLM